MKTNTTVTYGIEYWSKLSERWIPPLGLGYDDRDFAIRVCEKLNNPDIPQKRVIYPVEGSYE